MESSFENEYTVGKAIANNALDEFDKNFENAVEEIKKDFWNHTMQLIIPMN